MNDIKQAKGRLALPFQHEPPGAEEVTVVGVAGKILPEASTNTNQPGDAYRCDDAAAEAVVTTATITTITTTTSHEKDDDADAADENPTQIDTVTLKCDLNDYLINLITVRCSLAQSKLETAEQAQATTTTDECPAPENGATTNPDRHANVGATIPTSLACSSLSSYIPFDELVRYTELEREWTRKARSLGLGAVRRLRLCGGGEDSINNGTSAWGTPPGPASNGALSAWGVLPNQSLPPPAWGNVGGNNNNNNGGGGSSSSSSGSGNNPGVNSSSNGTGSNNGNNNNNGNGNNPTGNGGGSRGGSSDPNFNKTNAQSQQPGTPQVATPPNAWNTAGANNRGVGQHQANVANNNGNHHHQQQQQHHQHHHNQNHNHHQQQQQQPAPAGQNLANNGANGNNGAGNGTAKNQLEVLNTMREALFAQDGWGCQHVNQDTNWEVPGSPEPPGASAASAGAAGGAVAAGGGGSSGGANKGDGSGGGGGPNGGGSGGWKPQIMNNGTELWETNLRNGSAAPNQQQQAKAAAVPWVPANNLGGTWMEDDDTGGGGSGGGPSVGSDGAANVWNGSAAAIVAGTQMAPMAAPVSGSGWATPAANNASAGVAMWPPGSPQNPVPMNNPQVAVKKDEWGSIGGGGPPQQQQQQQPGPPGGGIIGVPPGSGGPSGGPGVNAGMMAQGWGGDGRTGGGVANPGGIGGLNLAGSIGQANALLGGGGGELRGDPRGISGRLNGVGAVGGGMGWGTTPDHIGGKVPQVGGGMLPSGAVSSGPAGVQPWGSGNGQNNNNGSNKMPSSVGGGWDDGGRPLAALDETTPGGGMLWGQGNAAAAAGVLARQNSSGWKDVGPDPMMRGGVHLQRNQSQTPLQGGGPFGPGIPGANSANAGVRFGGGGALGALGKPDAMPGWGQGNAALARNGSWEDGGVSGWGDEKPNMSWNVELAQNGTGGGWNKTPTTPKSGGSVGWPDPNDLSSAGGMDWSLGGAGKLAGASGKQLNNSGNPLEFIRASKEYRLLCEMGHKKEDVEHSLRTTGMIFDDAMEVLRQSAAGGGGGGGGGGGWRRPLSDEHGALGMGYDGPYSGRIPPLNHAASGLSFSQNNQNMLNNIPGGPGGGLGLDSAGGPVNLVALNNLKFLSQQQQQQQGTGGTGGHPPFNQAPLLPPGGRGPNQQVHQQQLAAAAAAQPSNQQLRMLVQQIQLAVQNGFLNHQILNQPLAPQTLILLNQLLNHIKQIQLTQSNLARSGATGGISAVQLTLAINKHKTQIAQLQQQIAAQQSIYLKQQQGAGSGVPGHQGPPPLMPSNPALGMDFLRQQQQQQQQQQDLMALQGNFAEMALGKDPIMAASAGGGVFAPPLVQPPQHMPGTAHLGAGSVAPGNVVVSGGSTSQQSRLNQWKLPSLEKDPSAGKDDLTDFSRAPGPTATAGGKSSTTSANLSSLGLVQDGTWATGRTNLTDGGWPEQTGETEGKDWSTTNNNNNTSSQDSSAFTDLVPEFEPGKPWKGTQLKIEDDPSITPGSVARSPLSISTAKESELFGGGGGAGGMAAPEKVSPTVAAGDGRSGGLNLTSSAWSFNTPSSTAVASGGKAWTDSTAGGGAAVTSAAADVWCTPIGKPSATRGPPPGLGGAASKSGNGGGGVSWSTGSQRGSSWGVGTSWLLLKNLTSQIDASTLRTLCMQHGPIVSFHSYPNHGLALCRYNTREEATTAQQALNNCPLGTGTISAECPGSESEVQTYLQQLGGSGGGGGGGGSNTVAVSSSTAGSISSISSQSWRQRGSTGAGADTWGSGWPLGGGAGANAGSGSGAANLWAPLDTADPGTPSSLNSFLPESLLGPELN